MAQRRGEDYFLTKPLRMRVAVIGVFASFGLVVATWAVHLPTMKQATGMSSTELGFVVLGLGVGALLGMQLSGVLVDRFGSGPIAIVGGAAMALGVNIRWLPTPCGLPEWALFCAVSRWGSPTSR